MVILTWHACNVPCIIYRGCTSGGVYVPCIYRGCTSGKVYVPCIYRGCTSGRVYIYIYIVFTEDVPLVEFMYLVKLYLHACEVRVTVGDSGLCCCTCVCYVF